MDHEQSTLRCPYAMGQEQPSPPAMPQEEMSLPGVGGEQSPPPEMNHQEQSPLFTLPQELRDEIYALVFFSTHLSYGMKRLDIHRNQIMLQKIKPPDNAIAILRTCKLMTKEIGNKWLSQVLFHFEDRATLYFKLTNLAPAQLASIRRLRVIYDTPIANHYMWHEDDPNGCWLITLFKNLSHLRLDKLILLGGHGSPAAMLATMEEMTWQCLDYWNELQYISHAAPALGVDHRVDLSVQHPQDQEHFNALLDTTDRHLRIVQERAETGSGGSNGSIKICPVTTYKQEKPCPACFSDNPRSQDRVARQLARRGPMEEIEPTLAAGYTKQNWAIICREHKHSLFIHFKKRKGETYYWKKPKGHMGFSNPIPSLMVMRTPEWAKIVSLETAFLISKTDSDDRKYRDCGVTG